MSFLGTTKWEVKDDMTSSWTTSKAHSHMEYYEWPKKLYDFMFVSHDPYGNICPIHIMWLNMLYRSICHKIAMSQCNGTLKEACYSC